MSVLPRGLRRASTGLLTAVVAALLLFLAGPGSSGLRAYADTAPPQTGMPSTVSSDPLPTVQIDGVVWTQLIVGDTVYVGGNFTTARPAGAAPGAQTVPRQNFLAYNLTTGELVDSFAPAFNGQVKSLAVSPDRQTLYVGGQFTQVNGVNRYRVVAFNLATGAVRTSFAVTSNSTVNGLAATNSTVYLAGYFTSVNNVARTNVAAVSAANGVVQPFVVTPAGGPVSEVVVSPDGAKVVLGGSFTTMNGSSNPGYGLAMVDATSGSLLPLPLNSLLRNGGTNAAITSLAATSTGFYGTGYSFSRAQGNVEGAFRADWNGAMTWVEDCHGDTYSLAVSRDEVYVAGHPHYCGGVGGFPQTPTWTFYRGLAFTAAATQQIGHDPHGYYNYAGQPGPSPLNWYPDINAGTFTGQTQGPWDVAANDDYVLYGGEFTAVNGTAQQGLVRFARSTIAPNDDGPGLGGAAMGLSVRSHGPALRVSWPANYDRDNERISYRLYRDDQLVHETTVDSLFYVRPVVSFLDRGVTPGQTHSYKLRAADPFGNTMWSTDVSGVAGAAAPLSRYQALVLGDGPNAYWPVDETTGTTMTDLAGTDNANRGSTVVRGVPGAIAGEPGTAYRLNGVSTSTMVDSVAQHPSNLFSSEAWFRTTSTQGGLILGMNQSVGGGSSYGDRHLYLSNNGQLNFAVKPSGTARAVTSPGTYRDGTWHHVVGTLSGSGMALYVDGVRVAFDPLIRGGLAFGTRTGYWRMGGDTLTGLPNRPTSNLLNGDLDEIATYPVALTAAQVQSHHTLGSTGVAPNVAPQAAFTATADDLSVAVDGSGSSDPDGSIASYAWDFGDGLTGTGVTAQHTYANPGSYTVTLVVTDDRGGTHTATRQVTATEPPNQAPEAAFTLTSSGLALSVDGSGSDDPDGEIDAYAWDFGDGDTGTGATAEHTYASAGSYLVRLTVTDDDGATDSVTQAVTVPTGGVPFALDEFDRTLGSGLGSADVGGAWSTSGASGFAVSGGDGIYKLSSAGVSRAAHLGGAISSDTDLRLSFTTNKPATGGGIYVTVLGRRVSSTEDYRLNLRLTNANRVTASLGALKGSSTATSLSSTVTLPGTYAPGTAVHVRMQTVGTNSTTLRAKVWLGSDPEPEAWTVSATDGYAGLQVPGSVGVTGYLSGSVTNAPIELALQRLVATSS